MQKKRRRKSHAWAPLSTAVRHHTQALLLDQTQMELLDYSTGTGAQGHSL